jgi:hypothetical protein
LDSSKNTDVPGGNNIQTIAFILLNKDNLSRLKSFHACNRSNPLQLPRVKGTEQTMTFTHFDGQPVKLPASLFVPLDSGLRMPQG